MRKEGDQRAKTLEQHKETAIAEVVSSNILALVGALDTWGHVANRKEKVLVCSVRVGLFAPVHAKSLQFWR